MCGIFCLFLRKAAYLCYGTLCVEPNKPNNSFL